MNKIIKKLICFTVLMSVIAIMFLVVTACGKQVETGKSFGGSQEEEDRSKMSVEEITELVQKKYFDNNGKAIMSYWGNFDEKENCYYEQLRPGYKMEEITTFEVSLLKDAAKPDEYNYYLVEFYPTGYITGKLTDNGLAGQWFHKEQSPYRMLNIPSEERYCHRNLGGMYSSGCMIDNSIVGIVCKWREDDLFEISGLTAESGGYSVFCQEIGHWVRYHVKTNIFTLNGSYTITERDKPLLEQFEKWLKDNPVDYDKIEAVGQELIKNSDYNLVSAKEAID